MTLEEDVVALLLRTNHKELLQVQAALLLVAHNTSSRSGWSAASWS